MVDAKLDGRVKLNKKEEEIKPIIVLEFAEGGELFEFISKEGRFKPEICRTLFKDLIAAI